MGYKKCPRCDLNYILDTEQYCKVCLVDMGKIAGTHINDDLDDEDLVLCPVCGENYLDEGESICYSCRIERLKKAKEEAKDSLLDAEDLDDYPEEFPIPNDDEEEPEEILVEDIEELEYDEDEEEQEEDEF